MIQKLKKNKKGFTLVELIVVVAILGVLMAVLVPQYIQYVEKSKQGTDAAALGEIFHAVEIESALRDISTVTNITVSATAGAVTIGGQDKTELEQAVIDVVGTAVALKSKAAQAFAGTITIAADGSVSWTAQAPTIADLTAGTATATTTP